MRSDRATAEDVRPAARELARLRRRLARLRAPAGRVSAAEQPVMLATLAAQPFSRPGWLYEVKYDGVRVLAERDGASIELYGRAGQSFTARYPEIVAALRALPLERFVLDGEVVALDERGRPSFQRLQVRMHLTHAADVERARGTTPVTAVFFDALALDGRDLRALPLVTRKELLELSVPALGVIHYGAHVLEHGEACYQAASEQRVEGIVAKRTTSRYTGGRSHEWLKIKCQLRQEFVVGGYSPPQGGRARFGSLHVGVYEEDALVYVGRVGTGFDDATLDAIFRRLQPLRRPTSPFARGAPPGRGHTWVEPTLVCEVRFTEWTDDGGFRHPAFLGMRDDKAPFACRRETAVGGSGGVGEGPEAEGAAAVGPEMGGAGGRGEPGDPTPGGGGSPRPPAPPISSTRGVRLTNLDKVFWTRERYTKGDVIAYYDTVAPVLLPYLRDRPLVLTRFPDGIDGKSFYQKDAPPSAPAWLRTEPIDAPDAGRVIDYVVVDAAPSLRYVVNLGAIPLHLWGSRVGSLEHPDWLILDLDPKGAPFTHVVRVAQALRRILDELEVRAYVKTSGATGLHILVPLGARYTWEETRTFAHLLATLGVEAEPGIATIARQIAARGGKVYIDWLQNVRGQTIVAPFSVRPLPGAPVSWPLSWDEVTPRLDPGRFTIVTGPRRLANLLDATARGHGTTGDPLAPVLRDTVDIAAALGRLQRRPPRRRR